MKSQQDLLENAERIIRVFRVGGAAGIALIILEGVAGTLLAAYLPFTFPLGASPLAELGAVMGASYCVAEVVHSHQKRM